MQSEELRSNSALPGVALQRYRMDFLAEKQTPEAPHNIVLGPGAGPSAPFLAVDSHGHPSLIYIH